VNQSNGATDTTNKVLVITALDRSGSMSSNRKGTIDGYNEYIRGLRYDKKTDYSVSLIQFDAPQTMPELTVSYEDRALADVPDLNLASYEPRGNTPLYDAIGECVRRTDANGRGVIMLIITDGLENASREFNKDSVKELIKKKEAEGWTFSFLGADIDSYAVGGSVGVAAANTATYVKGHEDTMFANALRATTRRAGLYASVGMRAASMMDFYDGSEKEAIENPKTMKRGGRPAAPSSFPLPSKPRRTEWKTTRP
jgi:hypothetical protein